MSRNRTPRVPKAVKEKILSELGQQFDIHPNQIKQWRHHLLEVFEKDIKAPEPVTVDVKTLHVKIGELTLENDFLSGALSKASVLSEKMIDPKHKLSLPR